MFTDMNMPLRNTPMDELRYSDFRRFSMIESGMPGSLVTGSKNIDLTRKLGVLAPRLGTEAQIASLGAGGVKGIHTYRRSSGDRPLFGHGTSLYKLSGTTQTLFKTTTADFDLGVKDDNVDTSNNEIKLLKTGVEAIDQKQETANGSYNATVGQTFIPQVSAISAIEVSTATQSATLTLKLYDTPAKGTLLGTATLTQVSGTRKFIFSSPVPVTKGVSYYFEATHNGPAFSISTSDLYANGQLYQLGVAQPTRDLVFKVYGSDTFYTSGAWTSPVYDLGTTPAASSIAWTSAVSTGLIVRAKGSEDNQNWGDWQTVSNSGGGIPRTRYVQISVEFNGGGITPSLQDFTITYETAFTQATSIKSGLSGDRLRFVDYDDVCYIADGGRPMRTKDGTNVTNVGVDPPSDAPTLAASSTGLTGTFKYGYTYVNEFGCESNLSPTASITLANQGTALSAVAVGPSGTTMRWIYRTKANGSIYYRIHAIEDNTTTTYVDTTADANLITELETDNDIPPNCSIVYQHKDYMIYVTGKYVYFSKRGLPDSVPANANKEFPGNITGVRSYQDALIVCGDNFTKAVVGTVWDVSPSNDNTETVDISSDYGALSHESMAECFSAKLGGDVLIFPTRQGLSYLTPGLQEDSMRTIPLSESVQPIFDEAVNKSNMCAVFHNFSYRLGLNHYGTDTPISTNNKVLVLDLRTGEWSPPWDVSSAGFCIANGKLYFGSPTIGRIYEMDKGTSDDGANIDKQAYLNHDYTPYGSRVRKKFKRLYVTREQNSDTSGLTLEAHVDSLSQSIGPILDWEGDTSKKQKINLNKGHKYQLVLKDNSTNDWMIPEIVTEYQKVG